ncbi:MAG: FlgO family outer membrane protein [Elusimicrobiota bacterium]
MGLFKFRFFLCAVLLGGCIVFLSAQTEEKLAVQSSTASAKIRIAVMDFESIGKEVKESDLGLSVAENLRTGLFKTGNYDVVERNFLMKLLEEQKLQSSGIVDSETATNIGKLSGAEKLVAGSVSKAGKTLTINIRFIDVKTGSVEKAESLTCADENEIPQMANDIVKLLEGETIIREKYQKKEESASTPQPGKKGQEEKPIKENPIDIDIGAKAGMFYPLDKSIAEDYDIGFLWGWNAALWIKHIGFQFESESYRGNAEKKEDIISVIGIKTGETKTETELETKPQWLSVIYRGKYSSYGFIGYGIGTVKAEKTVTVDNVAQPVVSDTFSGWQILTGVGGPHANLCFKYSKVSTDKIWNDVGLGGVTATLSIYF